MKMTLRGTAALRLLAAGAFCFGVGIALASAGNAATLLSGDVTVGNYYPNTSTLYRASKALVLPQVRYPLAGRATHLH